MSGAARNLCHSCVSHTRPCRVQAQGVLETVPEFGLVPVAVLAVLALAVIVAVVVVAAVDIQVASAWNDLAFDSPASTASAAVVVSAAAVVAVEAP